MNRPWQSPSSGRLQLFPMAKRHLDQVLAIEQHHFPEPWSRKLFEAEILHPAALPLCAVTYPADALAGYICLWLTHREVQVQNLAVAPDRLRLGIGRFLLVGGLLEAKRRGVLAASLEVRPSNTAARVLYASLGFHQIGIKPGYYTDNGEDALHLRCELDHMGN